MVSAGSGMSADLAADVVASMADAVLVVSAEGVIEHAGGACELVFGAPPETLVETSVDSLIPGGAGDRHARYRAAYAAAPDQRPMGLGLALRSLQPDGTARPIDVSLSPLSDGRVLAVVRDETEAAALRAEREQVQRLLAATDEGMFMFEAHGFALSYANHGASRMSGYDHDTLVGGMVVDELLHADDLERFQTLLRPLLAGEVAVIEFESTLRRVDDAPIPVDVLLQWPEPEGVSADRPIVALVRDIRTRRSIEAERDRNHRWAESLSDTRLALLAGMPTDDALDLVCRHACQLAGASVAVVLEPDHASDSYVIVAGSDPGIDRQVDIGPTSHLTSGATQDGDVAQIDARHLGPTDQAFVDALGVEDLIVAPLRVGLQRLGVLVAGRRRSDGPWRVNDAEMVSSYALEAAVALEIARARADQQRIARLEDREAIAADLHDMVIQRLFAAGMRLQGTLPLLDNPPVRARVSDVVDQLDETIAEIRSAIFGIQNAQVDRPTLSSAVCDLVASNERYLGFAPVLTITGELDDIPPQAGDQLIPVITEALSNVARHAGATSVEVALVADVDQVSLTITDNGAGIAPDVPMGRGLANLRRRAVNLGGSFEAATAPSGVGTVVSWHVRRPTEGS